MSAPIQVTLKPVLPAGPGLRLHLVGDDQLSGGVGTWNTVNRPRRRDAVEYAGTSAYAYVLPLLIDGMESSTGHDASVENDCRTLQGWAADVKASTKQPAVLQATGPLQTDNAVRWVIAGLEWGVKVRNGDGKRVQQYVTVTLNEYRAATVRKSSAKKSRARKGK